MTDPVYPVTNRVSEIMQLFDHWFRAEAASSFIVDDPARYDAAAWDRDTKFGVLAEAITALAAECERMRAVGEAAIDAYEKRDALRRMKREFYGQFDDDEDCPPTPPSIQDARRAANRAVGRLRRLVLSSGSVSTKADLSASRRQGFLLVRREPLRLVIAHVARSDTAASLGDPHPWPDDETVAAYRSLLGIVGADEPAGRGEG